MATHRYWRLYCTADCGNGNEPYCAIGTLQLRTSIGGTDVASSATWTADSTLGGFPVSNIYDGNNNSSWISGGGAYPHWVKADFGGSPQDIAEFAIAGRLDSSSNWGYQSPRDMVLASSDDDFTYTPRITVSGATDHCAGLQAFSSDTHGAANTVWRIRATAVGSGSVFAITEMEMRTTPGGSDECTGGIVLASSTYLTNTGARVVDNNTTSSFWSTHSYNGVPGWVAYKFSSAKSIVEVVMTAMDLGAQVRAPTAFVIERWDGSAFVSAQSYSGQSWSAGETKTFTFGSAPVTSWPNMFICM